LGAFLYFIFKYYLSKPTNSEENIIMPINIKQHLEEDIATLHELLIRSNPLPPRYVRAIAAPIIRKWLFENHLNLLAKEMEYELTLPSYDSTLIFKQIDKRVNFFIAGGVLLGGEFLRSIYLANIEWSGLPLLQNLETEVSFFKPSKLIKQNKIYFKQQVFNVEQIIKFYCNKDGGVHLDFRRNEEWQAILAEASEHFLFGNPYNKDEMAIIDLDEEVAGRKLLILPKEKGFVWNALDIEMLALAQSLLNIHCNGVRVIQ